MADLCIHEMVPEQCVYCQPASAPSTAPQFRRGTTAASLASPAPASSLRRPRGVITARYRTTCLECDSVIEPGDAIVLGPDDYYIHEECA